MPCAPIPCTRAPRRPACTIWRASRWPKRCPSLPSPAPPPPNGRRQPRSQRNSKRRWLVQQARETPIVVRKIADHAELMRLAIASYNDYQAEREMRAWERGQEWYDIGEPASERSDPAFLKRITVNYIRHHLTTYDRHLESVAGKVGVREAVAVIRDRVYGAVADTYPQYRAECNRQLARRKEQAA